MQMYQSPLSSRYAGEEIQALLSPQKKYSTWRKLWIVLAESQKELGLNITEEQINELKKHQEDIDFDTVLEFERKLKHDVMAHLHAYGKLCPNAMPILHLGATSCYITDNADLIIFKKALELIAAKLEIALQNLKKRALELKDTPCLSYTHFQPAQPSTLGKRITLWLQDFAWDAERLIAMIHNLPFLGVKGTTGTQASFLALLSSKEEVIELDAKVAEKCGFKGKALTITGQTYPRKLDTFIAEVLGGIATSAHKMAVDIRLLSHTKELVEKFSKDQVGSSAMPYKKNPIHSERICALARLSSTLIQNTHLTASQQWLERSLDDSANRRLVLPELFLVTDAILNLVISLAANFVPNLEKISSLLNEELPYMITENILMESVKKGGNRQDLHEALKKLSHSLSDKSVGAMIKEVSHNQKFRLSQEELEALTNIERLLGCAPSQVEHYIASDIEDLLHQFKALSLPSLTLEELL